MSAPTQADVRYWVVMAGMALACAAAAALLYILVARPRIRLSDKAKARLEALQRQESPAAPRRGAQPIP